MQCFRFFFSEVLSDLNKIFSLLFSATRYGRNYKRDVMHFMQRTCKTRCARCRCESWKMFFGKEMFRSRPSPRKMNFHANFSRHSCIGNWRKLWIWKLIFIACETINMEIQYWISSKASNGWRKKKKLHAALCWNLKSSVSIVPRNFSLFSIPPPLSRKLTQSSNWAEWAAKKKSFKRLIALEEDFSSAKIKECCYFSLLSLHILA